MKSLIKPAFLLSASMLLALPAGVLSPSALAAEKPAAVQKAVQSKRLPAPLEQAAKRWRINTQDIVISVVQADAPSRPVLAWNDARRDRPASVVKLVTTLAALETLGASWHWRTGFYVLEKPSDEGILAGGLFIRGGGDPTLVAEDFAVQVERLAQSGVRHIEGDIVLDRSLFNIPKVDPAAFDGRGSRPYNLQPDAALVSFRSLNFEFIPDREASIARVVSVPELDGVEMPATIPLSKGGCGDWKSSIGFELKDEGKGQKRVIFTGSLPAACGPKNFSVIAIDDNEYFERVFRELWERDGRTWKGHAVSGSIPKNAQCWLTRVSPSLGETILLTNKWSNNLMARHIFLALGADRVREAWEKAQSREKHAAKQKLPVAPKKQEPKELSFPRGTTLEDARAALDEWLAEKGIAKGEIWIENGSGLSRETHVTARAMTKMLAAGWSGPYMPEFLASLPITGKDGTMARRKVAVAEGRIKTGFLSDVRSIGGYIHAQSGKRYAVYASVHGEKNVPGGIAFLDSVIDWVSKL